MPDAGPQEMEWFNDLQRLSASQENAARFMEEFSRVDVRPLLAGIEVPTIVFHAQHDGAVPFDEGRLLAASIPGARFVSLPGRNHLMLEHEPAWEMFLRELGDFLGWSEPGEASTDSAD
jgi:pimeloyl-ACP methyl ester carboxylesterase